MYQKFALLLLLVPVSRGDGEMKFKNYAQTCVYILYNQTAKVASVYDRIHDMGSLFDGRGGGFLINYERSKAVYIPPETGILWDSRSEDFLDYFNTMPSSSDLYSEGRRQGNEFCPSTISRDLEVRMAKYLAALSRSYHNDCQAFATVVRISKITTDALTHSLKGFEENIGDNYISSRGDLKWLVAIFQGIADFFIDLNGIETLNQDNIHLDMSKVLTAPSGFHVLSYFINTLADYYDLGTILAQRLNTPESFFSLINKLEGDAMYYSFDGTVTIIDAILDSSSNATLRMILEHFYRSPRATKDNIVKKLDGSIQHLLQTIAQNNLEEDFRPLVGLLRSILAGRWNYNGVNMSKVLDLVVSTKPPGSESAIDNIIELVRSGAGAQ